jgi:hypothetical protein
MTKKEAAKGWHSEQASIILGVTGALLLSFGLLFMFVLNGVVAPSVYELSEQTITLDSSQRITGEEFTGSETPQSLDNAPILEDTERVYSNYTFYDYNCTYPSSAMYWRPDDPENYTCDCGCNDSIYKFLVEYEEEFANWTDPCYINYTYQMPMWNPSSEECDCGCDLTDGPWIQAVDIYDFDPADPMNESLWVYNYTLCWNVLDGYYYYSEEGWPDFWISSLCDLGANWNLTEPCEFENVTGWEMTSEPCEEDEECACGPDDGWFDWQIIVNITICTEWNETSGECEAYDNDTICVDEDYTWFFFQYPESAWQYYPPYWFPSFEAEEPGNLSVYTECTPGNEGPVWTEVVVCFNETNYWDEWEEFPPAEFWFASQCLVEGVEHEYDYGNDYEMDYEEGEIWITDNTDMFEGWDYLIDYDIFFATDAYNMRETAASNMTSTIGITGMIMMLLGMILIIDQFKDQISSFTFGRRGGGL